MVAGVKKYGYDIVNKEGDIVESDHDTYEGSMYDAEACIENAKSEIDFLLKKESK